MINKNLKYYLEKLESIIDFNHVESTKDLQKKAFAFQPVDHIPTVINYSLKDDEWPIFNFERIFYNQEKMLLNELRQVYLGAKLKDDRLCGVRANFGTGIIASMFGCSTHTFEDSLPIGTAVPIENINKILANGVPDKNDGLMSKVWDTVAYFRETLRPYPKLSQVIGSQCFDIQGPFDNASIIWGSDIYLAMLDEAEKVTDLMDLISETIIMTVRELRKIDGCSLIEHDGAWNFLGGVCVRNDSSVNLSGEHYETLVKPFDEKIIRQWGGWIHFCGKAHQWWKRQLDIPGLKGINPYQGEFYNLYEMFETCDAARIPIVQWITPVDERCRERIKTGFSRILQVDDFDMAQRVRDRLYKTGHAD
jgi:hypothetical protein